MKRYLCIILVLLLLLSFVGCGTEESKTAQKFVDKTVSVETFDPKDFSNSISVSSVADFEKIYKTKEELYDASQNVVYGTVKELSYFDESGAAHILCTFAVEEVYKGSLAENDLISVLTAGGYVRLSKRIEIYGKGKFENYTEKQINNTVIKSDNMGMPTPEVGDKYLLFLSAPIDNEPPFPDGVYCAMGDFMGSYVQQGDEFVRYKPASEPDFYAGGEEKISKTSVEKFLKSQKEKIDKVK